MYTVSSISEVADLFLYQLKRRIAIVTASIPYSFNSVLWRQRVTQWVHLIISLMVLLRWCVYPRIQSRILVGVHKYCA